MRLIAGIAVLGVAGCATAPTTPTEPVASCRNDDCFYQRDVRGVEAIDGSTAVFYVGPLRCPFVVRFDGLRCDAALGPHVALIQGGVLGAATGGLTGKVCRGTPNLYLYSGILEPQGSVLDPLAGHTPLGGFGAGPGPSPFDPLGDVDACRIVDIRSINDDQLVEMRVKAGIAPPPPPMRGRLQVPAGQAGGPPPAEPPTESPAPASSSAGAPAGASAGASAGSSPAGSPAASPAEPPAAAGGSAPASVPSK